MVKPNKRQLSLDRERPRTLLQWLGIVPWAPVAAVAMFIPGIIIWATSAIRCKDHTILFFNTVAQVNSSTIDAVTNAVQTTLITLAVCGAFVFLLGLILTVVRAVQHHKLQPDSCCACARPSPSSYTMYMAFNVGFNTIVFLVMMAIILLIAGAFLWLAVAYAANASIKYGVGEATRDGTTPERLGSNALMNLNNVVAYYRSEMRAAPECVKNSTWLQGINGTLSNMLVARNDTRGNNTVLCPYTCLNLGSFATLFKLGQNCICEQARLNLLMEESMTISMYAGVALGGLVLIYFACLTLNLNLTAQFTHARHEYLQALEQQSGWQSFTGGSDLGDPEGGTSEGTGKGYPYDQDDLGRAGSGLSMSRDTGGSSSKLRANSRGERQLSGSNSARKHKRSSAVAAMAGPVGWDPSACTPVGVGGVEHVRDSAMEDEMHNGSRDMVSAGSKVRMGSGAPIDSNSAYAGSPIHLNGVPYSSSAASGSTGLAVAAHGVPQFGQPLLMAAAARRTGSSSQQSSVDAGATYLDPQQQQQQELAWQNRSASSYYNGSSQETEANPFGRGSLTMPAGIGRQWQQQQQQQQLAPGMDGIPSSPFDHAPSAPDPATDQSRMYSLPGRQYVQPWEQYSQQQQQPYVPRKSSRNSMRELLSGQVPLTRSAPPWPTTHSSSSQQQAPRVSQSAPPMVPAAAGPLGAAVAAGLSATAAAVAARSGGAAADFQQQQQQQAVLLQEHPVNRSLQRLSHHTSTSSRDSRDSFIVHEEAADPTTSPYPGAAAAGAASAIPYTSLTHPPNPHRALAGAGSGSFLGPAAGGGGAGRVAGLTSAASFSSWGSGSVPQAGSRPPLHMIAEVSPASTGPGPALLQQDIAAQQAAARIVSSSGNAGASDVVAAAAAGGHAHQQQQDQQRSGRQQHRHQRYGAVDLSHLSDGWLTDPAADSSSTRALLPAAAAGSAGVSSAAVGPSATNKVDAWQQQQQQVQVVVSGGSQQEEGGAAVTASQVMQSRAQAPPRPQPLTIPEQSVPSSATTATTTAPNTGSSTARTPGFDQSPAGQLLCGGLDQATKSGCSTPVNPQGDSAPVSNPSQPHHHHHHHSTSGGAASSSSYYSGWGSNTATPSLESSAADFPPRASQSRSITPRYDDGRSPADAKALRSPYDRQRSGFRSSIRKGLIVYDQHKHRHAHSDAGPSAAAAAAAAAGGGGFGFVAPLPAPLVTAYAAGGTPPHTAAAAAAPSTGGSGADLAGSGAKPASDARAELDRRYRSRMPAL